MPQNYAMGHYGLLFLRLSFAGTMLMGHGIGKLMNFTDKAATFPDPMGIGSSLSLGLTVFAEFFCAIAVMVGFKTRYTVMPLIITMTVAFFKIHAQDPFQKKELALLYLFGFIAIIWFGPGKYSLDKE